MKLCINEVTESTQASKWSYFFFKLFLFLLVAIFSLVFDIAIVLAKGTKIVKK